LNQQRLWTGDSKDSDAGPARQPDEIAHFKKINGEKFFDEHEMKTISILVDIIIPKDEVSGSATDAKVPEFIEFIVKDMPHHQLPLRGGLKWLDMQCLKRYEKAFTDCSSQQQMEMVDAIAFPVLLFQAMQLHPPFPFAADCCNL